MPNERSWCCLQDLPLEQQWTGGAVWGATECSLSYIPAARHGGVWLPVLLLQFCW